MQVAEIGSFDHIRNLRVVYGNVFGVHNSINLLVRAIAFSMKRLLREQLIGLFDKFR